MTNEERRAHRIALIQERWRAGWSWDRLAAAFKDFSRPDLRAVCRETGARLGELEASEHLANRGEGRPWTARELTELAVMMRDKVPLSEMCARLGRTHGSVTSKKEWWRSNKDRIVARWIEGTAPKRRRVCMTCPAEFESEGAHHRLCDTCRDSAVFSGLAGRATGGVRVG